MQIYIDWVVGIYTCLCVLDDWHLNNGYEDIWDSYQGYDARNEPHAEEAPNHVEVGYD